LVSILLGTAAEEMSTNNSTPWTDTYVVAVGRYDVGVPDGWISTVSVCYKADWSADAVTLGRAGYVEHTEFLCNSSRSSCARMPADSMR
jgi:hypothetical protein